MMGWRNMQRTRRNGVLFAAVPVEYDGKRRVARRLVAGGAMQLTFVRIRHHIGSTDRLRHVDTGRATAVGGTHTLSRLASRTPLALHPLAQVWKRRKQAATPLMMLRQLMLCLVNVWRLGKALGGSGRDLS